MSETTEAPVVVDAAAAAAAAAEIAEKGPLVLVRKVNDLEYVVTDALGRVLVVRKLDQAENADMYEAAEDVQSVRWIMVAGVAASVRSMDGVPVLQPESKVQIKALLRKLGDAGMEAAQGVNRIINEKRVYNRYTLADENPAAAKN